MTEHNKLAKTEPLGSKKDRIILKNEKDTVELRQIILEDAANYFKLVDSDRAHLSQHGDETAKKYSTVESVENSILKPSNPDKYRFGIWDKDIMVGSNNLTLEENGRAELGSWVAKKHTGNRYAHRARKLLLDFAFNNLDLDEVYCEIVIGNIPSKKSVERSGLKLSPKKKKGKWIYSLKNPNRSKS